MALDCNDCQDLPGAENRLLRACRTNAFRTRGQWGMRCGVALNGFGDTCERAPCAIVDLARTLPHATRYGFTRPIVLASGPSWDDVLAQLVARGELS